MSQRPLTDDQKSTLKDILSNYDPSSLSESDISSLQEELRSSGIRPNAEMKGILEEAGFDAGQLRPKGPPPGGPPPGGPQGMSFSPGLSQAMSSFVDQFESGELSDEDVASLVEQLKDAGLGSQGVLIDTEG